MTAAALFWLLEQCFFSGMNLNFNLVKLILVMYTRVHAQNFVF